MTDRAESIVVAFNTLVTGLPQTQGRVERGRVYPVDVLPALTINMGAEQIVDDPNIAFQDEYLDVEVTASVKDNSGVDTALNQIRAEVYAAVMSNRTLGLSYVLDTRWLGRDTPDRSGELEQKSARQTMIFRVHYRHSYTSTES